MEHNYKKLITVCICAYGDFPHLISRCLDSLLHEPFFTESLDLIIGGNCLSEASYQCIEQRVAGLTNVRVVRSNENMNKSGMRRVMFSMVRTPYIVSCDDDITLKPGWLRKIQDHIKKHDPHIDASGFTLVTTPTPAKDTSIKTMPYEMIPWRKTWWRWKRAPHDGRVRFPGGGFHIIKTSLARECDFPDFGMYIDFDDILLGDLVVQMQGSYVLFPHELNEKIIVDLTPSRGEHWKG